MKGVRAWCLRPAQTPEECREPFRPVVTTGPRVTEVTKAVAAEEIQRVAVLLLAAHWFESAWNERVPQEVWDWAFEEELIAQVKDQADETIPYLTEKGQERLRGMLVDA